MARHVAPRVFAFSRRDPDQFGALEREACGHEHADKGEKSAMERAAAQIEIAEADGFAAENAEDHHDAEHQEQDDRGNLDNRKPIFRFAVTFRG